MELASGQGLPTGKELYSKMVDEADDMIMAMEEGREVDILQEVVRYFGHGGWRTLEFRGCSGPKRGRSGLGGRGAFMRLGPLFWHLGGPHTRAQ